MRHVSSRRRAENEAFAPDARPEAANFVYCVGCGKQLGQKSGLLRVRGAAINIYCSKCEGRNHDAWGADAPITYCFRCGTKHVRYVESEPYPTTHSICPRCRPERAARYSAGDFAPLVAAEETEEAEAEGGAATVGTAEASPTPDETPAPKKRGPKASSS